MAKKSKNKKPIPFPEFVYAVREDDGDGGYFISHYHDIGDIGDEQEAHTVAIYALQGFATMRIGKALINNRSVEEQ